MVAGGIGEDVSADEVRGRSAPNSSTGALVSATETLRFYDLANAGAYVGGFSVGLGALGHGLLLDLHDDGHRGRRADHPAVGRTCFITQQLSNVVGASRLGTVLSYANAPAVGATNNGFYASQCPRRPRAGT
jgi:hypothetical protein